MLKNIYVSNVCVCVFFFMCDLSSWMYLNGFIITLSSAYVRVKYKCYGKIKIFVDVVHLSNVTRLYIVINIL